MGHGQHVVHGTSRMAQDFFVVHTVLSLDLKLYRPTKVMPLALNGRKLRGCVPILGGIRRS